MNTQSNNTYEHLTFNGGRSSLFTISNTLHVSHPTRPYPLTHSNMRLHVTVEFLKCEGKKRRVRSRTAVWIVKMSLFLREKIILHSTCPSVNSWLEET